MKRKTETVICILFVLIFAGLMAFLMIVQPKTISRIDIKESVSVGDTLTPAIVRMVPSTVKMTLVDVNYRQSTAELTFSIRNDTDKSIGLVSDYVSCFTEKALLHGRSDENRYLSVDAHHTATWHVFIDGVYDDMTVYYMDIPNELVFASWKVNREE